jgi:hypothetical protein
MYLATVDWAISRPSLSSSPWTRGAPPVERDFGCRPIGRAACPRPRLPAPEQAKASAVPAEQGLRLEDDRRVEQGREQAIEADEDQAIHGFQLGSGWCRPFQDEELLPQVKDLSITPRVCAMQPRYQHPEKSQNNDHPGEAYPTGTPLTARIRFSVRTGIRQSRNHLPRRLAESVRSLAAE